ncbi:MAG: M28 family peptidase [Nitrospina sp.]|nr:M28 family peptidase [Nitrospina sp.]
MKSKRGVCLLLGLMLWQLPVCVSRAQEPTDYKALLWHHLKNVVEFGPRPPGSHAHAELRRYIKNVGGRFADSVREITFTYPAPDGEMLVMHNVEFHFEGRERGRPVLLGAHYDTRRFADEDPDPANQTEPIVGANDGGSGTAELLALAQYFKEHPPRRPVRLVFFDGEDYGKKFTENYFIGSKRYAADLGRASAEERPFCVLVIDMVGDRDLDIYKEVYSNENARWLVDLVFGAAEKRGARAFHSKPRYTIRDDHLPFLQMGIPAAVLIDFDYPYWHTQEDTLDKCSEESLYEVFQVVVDAVNQM